MITATLTRSMRRLTLGLLSALAIVAMMATGALAQYPPAQDLTVACAPENPGPGVSVTCIVSGAPGNAELDILVEINPVLLDTTVTTDAEGEATFEFDVPEDAQDGDVITITVSGEEVEGTLEVELAVVSDEVVDDDEEELADTGSEFGPLVVLGLVVAGLGVGAVIAGRRRERSRTSA